MAKRFMAYEIIKRLERQKETELLQRLNLSVEAKDRERNKKHEVWKILLTGKNAVHISLWNKNWIICLPVRSGGHDNPCRGKWNLVKDITEYVHSSARFYLCEDQDA